MSEKSDETLKKFHDLIIEKSGAKAVFYNLYNHYYLSSPVNRHFYVHYSAGNKGFWGIAKGIIKKLNEYQGEWCMVLLFEKINGGWLFPSHIINSGEMKWNDQGNRYIINQKDEWRSWARKYSFKFDDASLDAILKPQTD